MRAPLFVLDVETEAEARRATLRFQDGEGDELETRVVALDEHAASRWSALFDTRRHVRRMRDVEAPEAQLAELGRFLGEEVLGAGISRRLAEGLDQRTLLVRARPERGGARGARRGEGEAGEGDCAREGRAGAGATGVCRSAGGEAARGSAGADAAAGSLLPRRAPELERGGRRALPRGDAKAAVRAGA